MVGQVRQRELEEVLTEKEIHYIIKRIIGANVSWKLERSELKPAADGIAGFLADHMKAVLHVNVQNGEQKVHLFIKCLPMYNKPKGDFIDKENYFRREKLMFKVLDEICDNDPNPWCVRAYIYTDSMIVMPDISVDGYAPRHFLDTLDLEHVLLTTASIARFHATFVNYENKKSIDLKQPYNILQEFNEILREPTFYDSTWMRACSKLSNNLLKAFSAKSYRNLPDLEKKLSQLYIKACDSLTEYKETVNTLVHKDLWVNNIMFKYENNAPTSAVLIDYQCMRYAPPAFDLVSFLYLTTDKRFRQERERDIFDYYYTTFIKNLTHASKDKVKKLGYDVKNFLSWCEKARMFGMLIAIAIYPYVLLDPKTAQATFDDPETYEKLLHDDRSVPVIAHAMKCEPYKRRNLEVTEEFVEAYVLKQKY